MIRRNKHCWLSAQAEAHFGHIGQFASRNLLIRMYFRSKNGKGVTQDCLRVLDLILGDFLAYTLRLSYS